MLCFRNGCNVGTRLYWLMPEVGNASRLTHGSTFIMLQRVSATGLGLPHGWFVICIRGLGRTCAVVLRCVVPLC